VAAAGTGTIRGSVPGSSAEGPESADTEYMRSRMMSRFLRAAFAFAIFAGALLPATSGARTPKTAASPAPQHASPEPRLSAAPQAAAAPSPSIPPRLLNILQNPGGAPPQAYNAFTRGAQRQRGLVDILRKDDEAYFDLSTDQLGKTFILAPTLASGVGSGAFAGRVFNPLLVQFVRVGRRILWVEPNSRFLAPAGPAQASLDISVADSIIAASPIVAEDTEKKRIVIGAHLLLSDLVGIGQELGRSSNSPPSIAGLLSISLRPSFSVDATRSYVVRTKALPENDEILVNLTFSGPSGAISSVPDSRGIPIKVHYSLIAAPADGYVPRLADDRVGYFVTARKRLDDDARPSPFLRYIQRRNMASSPQIFYLTKEIPLEYRDAVRRGLLAWNSAFAKIGMPNAIEVKDAPDDPSWDPDDIRYSVVRWITSDRPDFGGMSMSLTDPRTGEILRTEIVIEGEAIRAIKRGYMEVVAPTAYASTLAPVNDCADEDCNFSWRFAERAALGTLMARLANPYGPRQLDKYAQDFVTSVVVHEAGHALGLEHNFEGHAAYTMTQLHDPEFTRTHGISASVMDYNAINLAPAGKPQGAFFQLKPGPYDDWAIEYGYKAVVPNVKEPAAELPQLRAIADRSTRHDLAFATDDDANGVGALDPRVAPFGLSNDPIGFASQAMQIDKSLTTRLERLSPHDAESYADERSAFLVIMSNSFESALAASRYIGGMYSSRAHRGQPGARAPFTIIPRAEQRRAYELVSSSIFAPNALAFSPRLLNDLGSERFAHWGSTSPARPDFPITRFVNTVEDTVLARLFRPIVMERLSDMEQKAKPGETMSLADLFEWTRASIWDDAATGARTTLAHRNIQRNYADLMAAIALLPAGVMSQLNIPYDAQALARHELQKIGALAASGLQHPSADLETRAHLENVQVRVRQALNATSNRPI
jgi:hypothetical protein